MRDNWCIGYSQQYTVGVWVGNFEGDSMHDVLGVTGAAPAWLEIINALQGQLASRPPAPPAGVARRDIHFSPAVEPPRSEWFVLGTETELVRLDDPATQVPRIVSPANAVIIALDPDIPYANQAVVFSVRPAQTGLDLVLDGKRLGLTGSSLKWRPTPGDHKLDLVGQGGNILDEVEFKVRGLNR